MQLSDFDYALPKELIAQTPVTPRDSSRLLVYERASGKIEHKIFRDLPELLRPNDVLVLNDTKVIPARLETQEGREVFLVREGKILNPKTETLNKSQIQNPKSKIWECLVRGAKHFEVGANFQIAPDFTGKVLEILSDGERVIEFQTSDFDSALEKYGATPLPPYIHQTEKQVPRYQTIYASIPGSVAAPTAGLHFTTELFEQLRNKSIAVEKVTLHVGLGTFQPVKVEKITEHQMHSEFFEFSPSVAERLNQFKKEGRRIIAVGTTACRVLESCVDACGRFLPRSGETDIFIYPGSQFRAIDALLTNFHLPKSTLLMLVSALIGREKVLELYESAIQEKYRFFSFGDAMLIL